MACENKSGQKRKPTMFSQTEIEAARQLIQLSNSVADSSITHLYEDRHSFNSYSVQWKSEQNNNDGIAAIEDVLAEIEEDERLRRRNNRYRYIQDLYNVTQPVVRVPLNEGSS